MEQDAITKTNMLAKLDWMSRSRLRIIENRSDPIQVQDHFLSYIHASQLIWFYFGRHVDCGGRTVEAGHLVDKWKESLSERQAHVWRFISKLRTADVHSQPIPVANTEQPAALLIDGQTVKIDGQALAFGEWRYEVALDGTNEDVFSLVDESFLLFSKFIEEFHSL